ncbi:hypothetical protein AA650_19855 [Anabaena sp. WA102]|nr:NB-ARC domain-containing protein [Anabaena sp. WA102]ALB42414.1 hypothetical protein AA650_19855 [Anabaena sp. WA102]
MVRSIRASKSGLKKAEKKFNGKDCTQDYLAGAANCTRQTVSKFFAGVAIDRRFFLSICDELGLEWREIADLESEIDGGEGGVNTQRGLYIPNTRCRRLWGRKDLVEKVLSRLSDPQEPSILALSGSAGYGKTEAATQIAKTALKNNTFADVLWVTARQTELVDGRISEENQYEVLNWNRFLHEIADQQLKCPVEGVHQRLKEEKLLVVLDNAETADLESILSKLNRILSPSRALLTSRVKTKPPYVGLIPIEGLDITSSGELLKDEAKYNEIPILENISNEQIERIHKLSCG